MTKFINYYNSTSYSEKYIYRLMSYLELSARIRKKKANRKRALIEHTEENILNRDFTTTKPNEKWLTDITEFKIPNTNKRLYLSAILNLYDNSIIEYKLSFRNTNNIVFEMFDNAILKNPSAKPIFHSDRGFQYTNEVFKTMLKNSGMIQSMSRPGKCIDNGPMESFWGALKTEMFYDKKFNSYKELIDKIHAYIKFYNEERIQNRLGTPPLKYRENALTCA